MTDKAERIEALKAERRTLTEQFQALILRGASIGETHPLSERVRLIDMELDHLGAPRSMFGGFLP